MLIDVNKIEKFCKDNIDNRDQRVLFYNIISLLLNPFRMDEIREGGYSRITGDYKYISSNCIAKYSLSLPFYYTSVNALSLLKEKGFNEDEIIRRRKWYGKEKGFVYDHARPVNITRDLLLDIDTSIDFDDYMNEVFKILNDDYVVVITREENSMLPPSTLIDGSVKKRYESANIVISDTVMKVIGAIPR